VNAELLQHIRQQTGAEFLLEIFHDRVTIAKVEGAVAARAALRHLAEGQFLPPGDDSHLAKELAPFHALSVEHFCSILNVKDYCWYYHDSGRASASSHAWC